MRKALWAGFLGTVLVAAVLLKIWDVAWVVNQGALMIREFTTNSQGRVIEVDQDTTQYLGGVTMSEENTYACPDGSLHITDNPNSLPKDCLKYVRVSATGDVLLGVDMGTMDYTPLQVTVDGYVKSAGRVKGSANAWLSITVDDLGRVICSPNQLSFNLDFSAPYSGMILKGSDLGIKTPIDQPYVKIVVGTYKQLHESITRPKDDEPTNFPCWITCN